MSRVRGAHTVPELLVRRAAHALGHRFRLHRRDLPGTPDLTFPRHRKVIFVHGCWWHRHAGCERAAPSKTRPEYWQSKFDRNVARDIRVEAELRAMGWDVLVVWECEAARSERLDGLLRAFL